MSTLASLGLLYGAATLTAASAAMADSVIRHWEETGGKTPLAAKLLLRVGAVFSVLLAVVAFVELAWWHGVLTLLAAIVLGGTLQWLIERTFFWPPIGLVMLVAGIALGVTW